MSGTATLSTSGAAGGRTAQSAPWYAPDARIRTRSAIRRALAVVRWVRWRPASEAEPDEVALFVALHVCAYQIQHSIRDGNRTSARRWWARWRRLREYIVESNLGLVHTILRKFRAADLDHDDLLSDAMFALARAVNRFNPWRGYRFSTYACNVIARALIRRAQLKARYHRLVPIHMAEPFERPEREDTSTELYIERLQVLLEHNLGQLTELETQVIAQRFPLDDNSQRTFRQIGSQVGLSKERVRQIQNTALHKLREAIETDPLLQ